MESKSKTILIVEDSDFLLLMLRKLFKTQGYKVLIARDGIEAQRLMHEMPPDLIVSDYLIPYKNGLELYKYSRESLLNKVPFILVSKLEKLEIEKFHSDDVFPNFINKPVNLSELLAHCCTLLEVKH